mmetsp:Transcript_17174/g.44025  ORF Transcript_17174/g.44025 Transcript_17174/m.44025 type:complete len:212 (-) Transcript_17174:683-1318(-)
MIPRRLWLGRAHPERRATTAAAATQALGSRHRRTSGLGARTGPEPTLPRLSPQCRQCRQRIVLPRRPRTAAPWGMTRPRAAPPRCPLHRPQRASRRACQRPRPAARLPPGQPSACCPWHRPAPRPLRWAGGGAPWRLHSAALAGPHRGPRRRRLLSAQRPAAPQGHRRHRRHRRRLTATLHSAAPRVSATRSSSVRPSARVRRAASRRSPR